MRAFQNESFRIWRCGSCSTIHARDEVDLDHYYDSYPFHALPVDWRLRMMYRQQLLRLRRAGVRRGARVLDYGCGGGHFVDYLVSHGFDARGFDEFEERFSNRKLLDETYDCVVSQDVIEHVPSPPELVDRFDALVEPGGVIAIGTPNASAVDLSDADRYEHPLHQPYHRHLLSKEALFGLGEKRGWRLERYYPTQYSNTLFPFLNFRFYFYYASLYDDSLDCLIEPTRAGRLLLRLPVSLFWGLFGYFLAPETDVMAVFRRP